MELSHSLIAFSADWACGGQFNRCFQFVQLLSAAFQSAQMDVVIFFDGTLKENKKLQFERNDYRQRTISVRQTRAGHLYFANQIKHAAVAAHISI
jgi:hypothetical protein